MARTRTVYKDAYNRSLRLLAETGSLPSQARLGDALGVSRTTVRGVLAQMERSGLIDWNRQCPATLRVPEPQDYYPEGETSPLSEVIERSFMQRLLAEGAEPGTQISELELARQIGVGTSSIREFLIRFSRFGLIEKRPNSHWVLKGFTRGFALELTEIRELFELRAAAAFAALPRANPAWAHLQRLEAEHRAVLADIDRRYADFSALDERFHRLIHAALQNRFVTDFYDVIAMVFHYHYQWNKAGQRERNATALHEHLAYIAALRSGDAARVDAACRAHLASARRTLLRSIPDGRSDA